MNTCASLYHFFFFERCSKIKISISFFSDVQQLCKKRWTDEENTIFHHHVKKYLHDKKMPPRWCLENVVKELKTRTIAQVRTRANNIIKKKQMYIM